MSIDRPGWPALFSVGSRANRLLRFALAASTVVICGFTIVGLLQKDSWGLDLSIIIDASQRWLDGGDPYVPVTGPETNYAPFLQPPYFLPLAAPLTLLPRTAVLAGWTLVLVVAAVLALRRLDVPLALVPFVLIWPPFMEGLYFGNVQVLSFAALAFLMWARPAMAGAALRTSPLDLAGSPRRPIVDGGLATSIAALKVTQVFPWFHLLGRRPVAALLGALVLATVAAATLLITGIDLWLRWADQLALASRRPEIGWTYSFIAPLGTLVQVGIISLAAVAAYLTRGPRAGIVVGILLVVASPSLRMHGLEYLLPAMLFIRREIALVGALLIALYLGPLVSIGVLVVVAASIVAMRSPVLREPGSDRSPAINVISM